jgi:hypothetical protein
LTELFNEYSELIANDEELCTDYCFECGMGVYQTCIQSLHGEIRTAVDHWVWPALPILLTQWKTTGSGEASAWSRDH